MALARLIVIEGPDRGREFDITIRGGGIGRGEDTAAQLTDPSVSRLHCSLEPRDGALWVVDAGSRNKTLVNGAPIAEHRLEPGDEITVGQTRLAYLPAGSVAVTRAGAPAKVTIEIGTRELMALPGLGDGGARRHLATLAALGERLTKAIGRGRTDVAQAAVEACVALVGADRAFIVTRDRDGAATLARTGDVQTSLAVPDQVIDSVLGRGRALAVEVGGRLVMAVPVGDAVLLADRATGSFGELELMAAGCLGQLVAAALAAADTQGLLTRGQAALEERLGDGELIGRSAAARALFELVSRVAPTDATVLLGGESGAGKEMVARAIHRGSRRAAGPCVAVNCAALTETLIESELFGHEKGAFTGATDKKIGRFEAADKGTLFLDEIGEMPLTLQTKLLRVLEERRFERVGGTRPVAVDVRLIAATNRDLPDMVRRGAFREDLYYRLSVIHAVVPSLRERADDIPLLAEHFLARMRQQVGRRVRGIRPDAMAALVAHPWPGNVRELRNAIERAVVLGRSEWIEEGDLPPHLATRAAARRSAPTPPLGSMAIAAPPGPAVSVPALPIPPTSSPSLAVPPLGSPPTIEPRIEAPAAPPAAARSLRDLEREGIVRALAATGGNKAQAAAILEIDRSTLYKKLKEYGIG
ncbi:MAG: sigma 54-dependent Fis family transcriptional regulator [Kofleriaceae bacterium]|nr:sigma 54-dependent Fis family transcriptional regulator [Kofleriaceae bacterium]MBP9170424.1 sigma 54-dependent Fis family transcriptional regulator [Kofleriaceae bacterium]MBP9860679.1 sigma 54-dependent Fis family transcriptional regulator [Kofleriaceae bacterium]